MTVIAYSAELRVMAADSRCTWESQYHLTNCTKIVRLKSRALVGLAGDGDARDFLALLESATPQEMPTRKQLQKLRSDIHSIVVFQTGEVFSVSCELSDGAWYGEVVEIKDSVVAIGSGAAYAYGAMDAGCSPYLAVRSACKRCIGCAHPIQVESL